MKKSNKNHLPHKNAPKNSIKKAKEIVRKVTRKGKRATYTLEDLQKAVDDVKSGKVGVRDAAEMYGIPRSTISANKNGPHNGHKPGAKPVLGDEIEKLLVESLIKLADIGLGLTKKDILAVVNRYIAKDPKLKAKFPPNGVTDRFYRSFMGRWDHTLSARIAQRLTVNRAQAITPESAKEFFEVVKKKKRNSSSILVVVRYQLVINGMWTKLVLVAVKETR